MWVETGRWWVTQVSIRTGTVAGAGPLTAAVAMGTGTANVQKHQATDRRGTGNECSGLFVIYPLGLCQGMLCTGSRDPTAELSSGYPQWCPAC